MSRITEFEIAGKNYPLNFSAKAAKEISKRYGDLSSISKAFEGKPIDQLMDEVIWLMNLLIDQGVAYKKLIEGEEINSLSIEELEIVLGVADFANLKATILGAMTAGMKREVEVEPNPKNEKTTQDS